MARRRFLIVAAVTLATLLGFASQAFADAGAWESVVDMPLARVLLGVASVAFTAALARPAAR